MIAVKGFVTACALWGVRSHHLQVVPNSGSIKGLHWASVILFLKIEFWDAGWETGRGNRRGNIYWFSM